MKAGRELDTMIAEKVMGLVRCTNEQAHGPHGFPGDFCFAQPDSPDQGGELHAFSTDIAAAWEVVEKLGAIGASLHLKAYRHESPPAGEEHCACFWSTTVCVYAYASTTPHAICLAALKASGVEAPA